MIRSLNAGVSGLRNHQVKIDVIGNNIANVNTTGFKAQRAEFQSLISQTIKEGTAPFGGRGGTNAQQIGLGIGVGAITTLQTQGALQFTGKSTDLALQGDGFFVLADAKGNFYTRDGSFDFDRMGTMVRPANGMKVQGWMAVNGEFDANKPTGEITIARGLNLQPKATTTVSMLGNLKSDTTHIVLDGVLKGSTTAGQISDESPVTVRLKLLTSKNDVLQGDLKLEQQVNSTTWKVQFVPDAAAQTKLASPAPVELGNLTFDSAGKLINTSLQTLSLSFKPEYGASPIEADILPTQLTVRPGVTSKIGLNPTSGQLPAGTKGELVAGRQSMTVNFFDSLGNAHGGNLIFSRDLDQQAGGKAVWRVSFTHSDGSIKADTKAPVPPSDSLVPIDMGTLTFDKSGLLVESKLQPLTLKYDNQSADSQIIFDPGKPGAITGLTQFTTSGNARVGDQDGFPTGTLQGYSIDDAGIISGVFTNGQIRNLAQVAIATFANPQGLVNDGSNLLSVGNNSGNPQIGVAHADGRADVTSGSLEGSNVDLAQSFADLIITQRGFQANSRIITTSDEMLQELIGLKR